MRVVTAPGRRHFTDDQLLDAARDAFHASGYHAAQMRELAEAAGTTKPTLYARLGPKHEIYRRVLAREAERLMDHLGKAYRDSADKAVDEMIEISTRAFFDHSRAHPVGVDLLFRSEPNTPGTDIVEKTIAYMIDQTADLGRIVMARVGATPAPTAVLVAAAGVGGTRQVFRHAADHGIDHELAADIAVSYARAGWRGIDPDLITRRPPARATKSKRRQR